MSNLSQRRNGDRLYTVVLLAFLVGLIALGLLGVPALLVAAVGLVLAAAAIGALHGRSRRVPAKYAPSVLEASSIRRRRLGGLRRHRTPNPPLRFR
jgi:hypothetical protein